MSDQRILFAGLPSSGKSTYVGLLFTSIEERACSLRLNGFQGDLAYVNSLADRLARCEEAPRTDVDRADGFNADLRTTAGHDFSLRLPDYSGETWKTALEAHGWSETIDATIRESTGLCLFVKVGAIVNDGTIVDARRLTAALHGALPDASTAVDTGTTQVVPVEDPSFEPTKSTQLALVELLQALVERRRQDTCRLSIVISAFDLAGDITPARWLSMNLPLLDQYLRSNTPELSTRVFGVSAQGDRFTDDTRPGLLQLPVLDRAFVRDSAGETVDVDAPVLWAAGLGDTT